MKRARTIWGVAAIAIGALLIAVPGAGAKTYEPNKTSDHTPNGCTKSDCTLREAVIAANDTPGFDVIVLKSGAHYTRSAAGTDENQAADGDLDISYPLKIETEKSVRTKHGVRKAKPATIDANDNERVIDSFDNLTVLRVVLRDGATNLSDSGGGIHATDPLTVRSSTLISNEAYVGAAIHFDTGTETERMLVVRTFIKGNKADSQSGGFYMDGPGTIKDSKVIGNHSDGDSGAFHSHYDVTINRTTFSGNSSVDYGGGIYNDGSIVTVRNSTVSGNFTIGPGAQGGGIHSYGDTIITNSTIASNHSAGNGGGISVDNAGSLSMNGVTVVRNRADTDGNGAHGGGIYEQATTPLVTNSIIALNTVGGASTNPDCFGAFNSTGHNLLGIITLGCTGFISAGDLIGGPFKLGPLKSNGGPTKTVGLLKGSRAINHGGDDAIARDQRGRKKNGQRDIGAFEYKGKS